MAETIKSVIFTDQELIKVLESNKFQEALALSSHYLKETGCEAGFCVETYSDKSFRIPYIKLGGTDSTEGSGEEISVDGSDPDVYRLTGQLLDFHFHPEVDEGITPSSSDISLISLEFQTFNPISILGVGHLRTNSGIDILMIKPKEGAVFTYDEASEYQDFLDHQPEFNRDQIEIIKALERAGLGTSLIKFYYLDTHYSLIEQSQQQLKNLTPVKVMLFDNGSRPELTVIRRPPLNI